MKGNVIFLESTRQYYTARELLNVLQSEWSPSDKLTLRDFCRAVERWEESVLNKNKEGETS